MIELQSSGIDYARLRHAGRDVLSLALIDARNRTLAWATLAALPIDNASAGLPPPASIVNNFVSSVAVESGAIQVTFGNHANAALRGKMLSFRPGVVEASPIVPITWVCGHASPPVPMNARGLDKTSIPDRYLPLNCRAATPGS